MTDSAPTWLKIMENGSVGEARTKAFLIDRFWILERSVDVDGADFLIQRRNAQRFTDRTPPRVGVVQAKYFQDTRTTQHIRQSYVLDEHKLPLDGFFAMLHVGSEDNGQVYLLSARDIHATLKLSSSEGPPRYIVGADALIEKFRVTSRTRALDAIEHSIKIQSFVQAQSFWDTLNVPYRKFDIDAIDYNWTLPISNPIGDIPAMFLDEKKKLQKVVFDMEEVLQALDGILATTDPAKASDLLDDVRDHVGAYGLSFGDRGVFQWGDLNDALTIHERRRSCLDSKGVLKAYIALGDALRQRLDTLKSDSRSDADNVAFRACLAYEPATLAIVDLAVSLAEEGVKSLETSRSGTIEVVRELVHWTPKKQSKRDYTLDNVWWRVMQLIVEDICPDTTDQ